MARARTAPGLLLGGALLAGAGCGILDPGQSSAREELEDARRRWEARGWPSYTVQVARACECLPEAAGPFRVTVEAGSGTTVRTLDGNEVDPAIAADVPTVEGLFAMVEEALDQGVHRLTVRYDPVVGSPRSVVIDIDARVADEELVYDAERPVPLASFELRGLRLSPGRAGP
jgi:hypothetical protein